MKIWCNHNYVVADNSEIVCRKCGIVMDDMGEKTQAPSQSKANLYELREVGSKGALPNMGFAAYRNSGDVKRYFGSSMAKTHPLSGFSKMCKRLSLPLYMQENAWRLYTKAATTICVVLAKKNEKLRD